MAEELKFASVSELLKAIDSIQAEIDQLELLQKRLNLRCLALSKEQCTTIPGCVYREGNIAWGQPPLCVAGWNEDIGIKAKRRDDLKLLGAKMFPESEFVPSHKRPSYLQRRGQEMSQTVSAFGGGGPSRSVFPFPSGAAAGGFGW